MHTLNHLRTMLVFGGLLITATGVGALELVKEGQPVGEIVIPDNASTAEVFAADDFQHWVKEITGAIVPVLRTPSAAANTKLLIGRQLAGAWKKELAELAGSDGFAIRRRENILYVFGDCPRGTAYGMYHLLEANTDIIWSRPDETFGTVFGKTANLALNATDVLDKPAFRMHGWNVVAVRKHRPTGIWVWRNRGNYADQTQTADLDMIELYGGGHAYFSTMVPPNTNFGDKAHNYFATHPEFYGWDATKGGRYPETLCLTSPELPAVAAANVAAGVHKLPKPPDYLCLGMRDTYAMCQCPECQKPIKLADGRELKMLNADAEKDPLFASTRYFTFMNQMAAELKKTCPNIKLLVPAYFYAAEVPACDLDEFIYPYFCPIGGRNSRFPLLDERQDKTWRERFEKWLKKAPGRLCFYEYYRSYGSGTAVVTYGAVRSAWGPDLRALAASGSPGVISELTPDVDKMFSKHSMQSEWDANSMDAWVLARLLWNPNQDVDTLRDYYLDRTFREAAPAMKRFYALMQQGWDQCATPKKGFQATVVDAGIEPACVAALAEAEALAKHPNALEMIRRLKAQWALTAAALGRLAVPRMTGVRETVDYDSPHWEKALVLNNFRLPSNWNWGTPTSPRMPTEVRVLHDGTNLYFRYTASVTNAEARVMAKGAADTWPNGEHGEIYLQNKSGSHLFAFDGNGNAYDALNFDKRWNAAWRLQARKTEKGWQAVGVVPLAALKFKPGAKDAALSLFVLRHYESGDTQEDSSLNGGVPGRMRYPIIME